MYDQQTQTMSFDQLRGIFARAAEVRDREQGHLVEALEDIYTRLQSLESLGGVRTRLGELPDREEFASLAARLDQTAATLQAQHAAIGALTQAVGSVVNRLSGPLNQLDGRLNAMAGRMEGVSGRMGGLDDKLAGIHKRHDELDNRLDRQEGRLEAIPAAIAGPLSERLSGTEFGIRERIDEIGGALNQRLEYTKDELREGTERSGSALRQLLSQTNGSLAASLAELTSRPAVDPSETLDELSNGLKGLNSRLDGVEQTLNAHPDTQAVTALVAEANQESERRSGNQLDSALATFAGLMLNAGAISPAAQGGPDSISARRAVARRPVVAATPATPATPGTTKKAKDGSEPAKGEDGAPEERLSA